MCINPLIGNTIGDTETYNTIRKSRSRGYLKWSSSGWVLDLSNMPKRAYRGDTLSGVTTGNAISALSKEQEIIQFDSPYSVSYGAIEAFRYILKFLELLDVRQVQSRFQPPCLNWEERFNILEVTLKTFRRIGTHGQLGNDSTRNQ